MKNFIIILIMLLTISICSASGIDDIIETSKTVDDWKTFENFSGNVQIYIDGEPCYLTIENKTVTKYDGEISTFEYEIFTNEKDIKIANDLLKTYSEKEKLNLFDSVKTFLLLQKTPIYHNSKTVKFSDKIGMAVTW